MPSFNKVILAGNLTRDPETKTLPSGTTVCQFGLAINRQWTGEDGQKREEVTFLDCKAFGRQAETLGRYCRKGGALLVEGRITREEWDDKTTGQKKSATRIVVDGFQFLGGKREEPGSTPAAPAESPATGDNVPL